MPVLSFGKVVQGNDKGLTAEEPEAQEKQAKAMKAAETAARFTGK